MERHRKKGFSPSLCLRIIDRQLEGEAERWAKTTPSVRITILKAYGGEAAESDVEVFCEAITQRFKLTDEDVCAMRKSLPQSLLVNLHQAPSENLEHYYGRARDILLALHGRDDEHDTLTPLEISMRSIVIAQFVRYLRDDGPASESSFRFRLHQQQVLHPSVSLHKAFKMAEAESKRTEMEKESKQKRKRQLPTNEQDSD